MTPGIVDLALIVAFAGGLGILMRMLRQPLIIAYLATGFLIGAFHLLNINDREAFTLFSDLGITFLLFLVGLEINYTSLRMVGKTSLLVGIGQIIFTSLFGFLIALAFNFSYLTSAYIAIALTFSSTIIIVKLLSEKQDTQSLYGKISIGFMLVQDFVAILILIILSGVTAGEGIDWGTIVSTIVKGILLFVGTIYLGRKFFPYVFDRIARTPELLYILSIAWVLAVATIVSKIGFSIEIGGFLAGLALANSSEHYQIASRMKPMRDFFILIFFAVLGSSLAFFDLSGLTFPVVVFSAFVLIGNPLIVLIIMGSLGYRKRTSFLAGVTVAQISEFSLILGALGVKLGHISQSALGLITAVGIITIVLSTYVILYAHRIYPLISKTLRFFERKKISEPKLPTEGFHPEFVLIGARRVGASFVDSLPKDKLLIIDFDPEVVVYYQKRGYQCLLGDISDVEIFYEANVREAGVIISTSADVEDTLILMDWLKRSRRKRIIIVRAENDTDAREFYKKGADYVIQPHFTAGHYIGDLLNDGVKLSRIWKARERDYKLMERSERI